MEPLWVFMGIYRGALLGTMGIYIMGPFWVLWGSIMGPLRVLWGSIPPGMSVGGLCPADRRLGRCSPVRAYPIQCSPHTLRVVHPMHVRFDDQQGLALFAPKSLIAHSAWLQSGNSRAPRSFHTKECRVEIDPGLLHRRIDRHNEGHSRPT